MRYTADDRLSESVSQTGYTYTYASCSDWITKLFKYIDVLHARVFLNMQPTFKCTFTKIHTRIYSWMKLELLSYIKDK